MLKLIKFEFIRKKMLFAIAIALVIIGQVYALFKYFDIEAPVRAYIGQEVFAVYVSIVLVVMAILYLIDIILLFRNDLFKQEGYMLFMTPNSGYKILGAKLIFALLEGVAIAAFYLLLVYFNLKMMKLDVINFEFFKISTDEWMVIVKGLLLGVFVLLEFALTVYLSFALFKSIFSNVRFKGLITFFIFIAINVFKSKIMGVVGDVINRSQEVIQVSSSYFPIEQVNQALNYGLIATMVSAVLLFVGTGYLLENRINL